MKLVVACFRKTVTFEMSSWLNLKFKRNQTIKTVITRCTTTYLTPYLFVRCKTEATVLFIRRDEYFHTRFKREERRWCKLDNHAIHIFFGQTPQWWNPRYIHMLIIFLHVRRSLEWLSSCTERWYNGKICTRLF